MRIISVTPAGRQKYLKILVPYLLRFKGQIQEHHFWVNTADTEDVAYIRRVCDENPDYFKFVPHPNKTLDLKSLPPTLGYVKKFNCLDIAPFHTLCTDRETIYIRFDDDICWIADDFVENIVKFRIDNPGYFLVSANVINNAVCAMLHQRFGLIKFDQILDGYCMGNAWKHPFTAITQHKELIKRIKQGTVSDYKCFKKWVMLESNLDTLSEYCRSILGVSIFSINCVCWFGKDYEKFKGIIERTGTKEDCHHEEAFLTYDYPRKNKLLNVICGDALVSHFSFYTQRIGLEKNTDLLEQYEKIAYETRKFN